MAAKKSAKKSSAKKSSKAKKKVVKIVKKTLKTVKKVIKKRTAPKEYSGTIQQYYDRMRYWRQMTSQAREFIRKQYKKINDGSFSELRFLNEVDKMRKHWIGPKVPVKRPQKPHRSSF